MSSKNTKRQQAQITRNVVATEKATSIQLDTALGALSKTSVHVQGLFGQVGEELIMKHSELKALIDTIELKKAELAELHEKDKILLSTDDLIAEHAKEKARLAEELNFTLGERDRENADFEYALAQARKEEEDKWTESVRLRDRANKIKLEEFEKNLKERNDAILATEKQYQEALSKLASFDSELKRAVDKEVSIIANSLKREHTHASELAAITYKSELKERDNKIKTLEDALSYNTATIANLQIQLKDSQAAQTQLAKDAVSAAANQKVMADMQSLLTNTGGPNGSRAKM
jgi:hypothetical protein